MSDYGRGAPRPDLAMIRELEEQLFDPAVRRSPEAVAALLSDDFIEVGRSGVVYDKAAVVRGLAAEVGRARAALAVSGFRLTALGRDAVLLTYRTVRVCGGSGTLTTLRSSVWVWTGERWAMAFHQGTPVGAEV